MQELVSSHVKMNVNFHKILKYTHQTTNGKKLHFYSEVLNNSNLTHLKINHSTAIGIVRGTFDVGITTKPCILQKILVQYY